MSFGYSAYIIIRLQDFRALRVSTSWRNTFFFLAKEAVIVFYRIKTTLQQRTILSVICLITKAESKTFCVSSIAAVKINEMDFQLPGNVASIIIRGLQYLVL